MRCILISQQGSGTTLFRSFINSHKDICFLGELYRKLSEGNPYKNELDNLLKLPEPIAGFDLKYNQLYTLRDEILSYIKSGRFKVIHFLRDPARACLQTLVKGSKPIGYYDLKRACKEIRANRGIVREVFSCLDYHELRYEEMTLGREIRKLPESFENKLSKIFGVECKGLKLTDVNAPQKLRMRF